MLIIVYCCAHAAVLGKTYTSANRFITVMADDAGYLWAGTENDGLLRLNKNTGETAVFTSGNSGLVDNGIQALAFDGQDRLIVGTAWQGVVRFDGTRWERLPGLPAAGVRGVAVDSQGTMWACTNAGVVRLKGGAWETVINRVSGGIAADGKGGIWICNTPVCNSEACAGGGIYEYVNGGLQSTIALSSVWSEMTSLNAFAVDMKRNAWIGTRRELMQISDFTANRYVVSSDTMSPKSVAALAVDRSDRVMIALTTYPDTSEIFIYDPVNKTGQPLDSVVKTYGNLTVTAACAHLQGGFWLGASNGTIIRLDEFNRDTMYSAGNSSIPGNTISSLIIDDRNCVWAKSDRPNGDMAPLLNAPLLPIEVGKTALRKRADRGLLKTRPNGSRGVHCQGADALPGERVS